MTDRLELIHDLHQAGGQLALKNGRLVVKAESLPTEMVARLQGAKPELLRILAGPGQRCPGCGGLVARDRTFDGFHNRLCIGCGRWLQCERDGA